jgi:hypothetical protein
VAGKAAGARRPGPDVDRRQHDQVPPGHREPKPPTAGRSQLPSVDLDRWLDQVADFFARPEPRLLLKQMTVGLLSSLRTKNGWTLVAVCGAREPGTDPDLPVSGILGS